MSKNVVETVRDRLYRRVPVFSFEFFPPKDEAGMATLERSLAELAALNPAFVSVTCGAGGSTRELTRDLVLSMQERYDFGVMAHITAMGYSRTELADLVADYRRRGIRNFLALRGDPPRDRPEWQAPADQAATATEVVEIIRSVARDVSVGVAGYPEFHPQCASPEDDLRHLGEKVAAGADFVVTQLFFNNEHFFNFVARARRYGVTVPILPGIMPVTRSGQVERFREMCRVTVPPALDGLLADEEAVRQRGVGVAYAAAQCADLLRRGACGIHFYTLNQSRACHTLFEILTAMGW
ncbi:MAG: methylenetetrahydrofolate reductase [NAD(P)H] [Planctomycetes bacterium]|nr:methylenetetrahydrofolate reductase [NAD(P)H] [Planctomycetota bacterium]